MTPTIPRAGEIFEQRYELLEVIRSGGNGTVFKSRQIESKRSSKALHPGIECVTMNIESAFSVLAIV